MTKSFLFLLSVTLLLFSCSKKEDEVVPDTSADYAGLLVGKYVPLALTFTIAIMLNAALFHILMDAPANAGGAIIALILSFVLVYAYKDRFNSLLSA